MELRLRMMLLGMMRLLRVQAVLLRGSGGAKPGLWLQLRVVYHTGGRRVLHPGCWGGVRMLRVVLLRRVTGRRVTGSRGIRIVIVPTCGRSRLHRFSGRVGGGSGLLLWLLARVTRRERVDELIGTHCFHEIAPVADVTVPIAPHVYGSTFTRNTTTNPSDLQLVGRRRYAHSG